MTKHEEFALGRGYWLEYLRVNGYSFDYTDAGVRKLGRLLDLNTPHLRRCLHIFLHS